MVHFVKLGKDFGISKMYSRGFNKKLFLEPSKVLKYEKGLSYLRRGGICSLSSTMKTTSVTAFTVMFLVK